MKHRIDGEDVRDKQIGARLRERRIAMGLTQQQLAAMIGVTYQQAHKYETGINRISAGRLYDIAQKLKVPVSYFHDESATEDSRGHSRMRLEIARTVARLQAEESLKLVGDLAQALVGFEDSSRNR